MLDLTTIQTLRLLIAVTMAYFPTVTLTGIFAAWLARKFGDQSLAVAQMITFNPLVHMNFVDLGLLFFSVSVGFPLIGPYGQMIPVDQHSLHRPLAKLKYFILLMARPLMSVFLCCLSIFLWMIFLFLAVIPSRLAETSPAFFGAMQLLYGAFRELNIITAILGATFGLVRFILESLAPRLAGKSLWFVMLVEIYLLIFFWYFLSPYLHRLILLIESGLGHLVFGWIG